MPTWTVVGLLDVESGDLHVAGVFPGVCKNMDSNVDAEVAGLVLDQFVGYFDAEHADDAAEIARQVMKEPVVSATSDEWPPLTRAATDVQVKDYLL